MVWSLIMSILFSLIHLMPLSATPPAHSISGMDCNVAIHCTFQHKGVEVVTGTSTSIQLLISTSGTLNLGWYNQYRIGVATGSLTVVAPSAGSASSGTVKISTGSASTETGWSQSVGSLITGEGVLKDTIGAGASNLSSSHRMTISVNPATEGNYAINLTAQPFDSTDSTLGDPSTITFYVIAKSRQLFSEENFTLVRDAVATGSTIALTPNAGNKAGAVFSNTRVNLASSFSLDAELNFGNSNAGADGIAFVFQPNAKTDVRTGGGIGYDGMNNAFAVEFDTYDNGGEEAGKLDHSGLMKSTATNHAEWIAVGSSVISLGDIEDDNWYPVQFSWVPKISAGSACGDATKGQFTTKFDKNRDGDFADAGEVLYNEVCLALEDYFSASSGNVYYGFTAATGGAMNLQQVRSLGATVTSRSNTPPSIADIANYQHGLGTPQRTFNVAITDESTSSAQWGISVTSSDTNVLTVGSHGTPPSSSGSAGDLLIRYTPSAVNTGTSTITITITDADGAQDQTSFTVTVVPAISITTPTSGLSGTVGSGFSLSLFATGGSTPYSWSVTGDIPPGLSLDSSTGQISGTPGSAGTFPITVTVADWDSVTASTSLFELLIANPPVTNLTPGSVVSFAPNGADNTGTMQSEIKGDTKKLLRNRLVRSGFNFAGWNTRSDGSGTSYPDESLFKFEFDHVILYAQWRAIKRVPVVTWANPEAIASTTPLSNLQLNATGNVPGVCTYTPAIGALLSPGTKELTCDFIPTDSTLYESITKKVQIEVLPIPVITWSDPNRITRGTPLTSSHLNATATVPGTLTYSPSLGVILKSGLQKLSVTLTPNDTRLPTVTSQVTIEVVPALTPKADEIKTISGESESGSLQGITSEARVQVETLGNGLERVRISRDSITVFASDAFTGKTTVLLRIEDEERVVALTVPVTVLPRQARGFHTLLTISSSRIDWSLVKGAAGYRVSVDSSVVCSIGSGTTASCTANLPTGPKSLVEIVTLGNDKTESETSKATFLVPENPVSAAVVNFATASSKLSSSERRELRELAAKVGRLGLTSLQVRGHTDSVGGINNQRLSSSRANATRKFLQRQIPSVKISILGSSFREPVSSNETESGKANNRRAEIFIKG